MSKKLIVIIVLTSIFVLVTGLLQYRHSKTKQELGAIDEMGKTNAISITSEVEALYLNSDKIFLKKGISKVEVKNIQKKVKNLKVIVQNLEKQSKKSDINKLSWQPNLKMVRELQEDMVDIRYKFELQQGVNNLFQKKVLDGDQFDATVAIKQGVNKKSLQQYLIQDRSAKNLEFRHFVLEAVIEAEVQYKQQIQAEKAVNALSSQKESVSQVSSERIQQAQIEINKVKNQVIKQTLTQKLKRVKEKSNARSTVD